MKKNLFGLLFSCAALVAMFALSGCSSEGASTANGAVVASEGSMSTPSITVTANSEVKVVPDKAEVGLAVTTQAATAEATQESNNASINAVIAALQELGLDEKSIQTTDTWLNPRYDYSNPIVYAPAATSEGESMASTASEASTAAESEASAPAGSEELATAGSEGGAAEATASDSVASEELTLAEEPLVDYAVAPTPAIAPAEESTNIVGYEMTTRLTVSDLDIDQVGEVISAAIAAGANNTDGIRYYSSTYDEVYAEALAKAVEDARAKAEVLAKAAGVGLGGVHSMTEGYQNTAYRYDTGAVMESAAADSASMKVMPGELDVTASVTIAYEIK